MRNLWFFWISRPCTLSYFWIVGDRKTFFRANAGGSGARMPIQNTYPKLGQIYKAKFELGWVNFFNPACDCGITDGCKHIRVFATGIYTKRSTFCKKVGCEKSSKKHFYSNFKVLSVKAANISLVSASLSDRRGWPACTRWRRGILGNCSTGALVCASVEPRPGRRCAEQRPNHNPRALFSRPMPSKPRHYSLVGIMLRPRCPLWQTALKNKVSDLINFLCPSTLRPYVPVES